MGIKLHDNSFKSAKLRLCWHYFLCNRMDVLLYSVLVGGLITTRFVRGGDDRQQEVVADDEEALEEVDV